MRDLRIGEVARGAGLRTSAIRYYEKVGLLPRAPRVGRQRRYEPQVIERLVVVRFAQFVGLTIKEIKWLLNEVPGRPPPERWRQLARQRLTQLDTLMAEVATIRKLLQMTLDNKCPRLVEHASSIPEGRHVGRRLGAERIEHQDLSADELRPLWERGIESGPDQFGSINAVKKEARRRAAKARS
jgi:MerR family redox-sensitive transcriptional activator SoxR